ncbi:MAG: hypothetical protein GDA43_25540 [Hormoscilla sp. SP5CHS1]|nr:hypothetical protein [Hormoscilla sp. SP5CHS1]
MIACIVKKFYHERITNRGGDRLFVGRNRVYTITSGQDPRLKRETKVMYPGVEIACLWQETRFLRSGSPQNSTRTVAPVHPPIASDSE